MFKHAVMWGAGAIAIGLLSAGQASASLLSSEQFSYTGGASVSGQNGGTGWSGAWTGTVASGPTVNATSLSANSQPTAGGRADTPDSNVGAFRVPTLSPDTDGTTLYISFLAQAPGNAGYAGFSLFNGATEVLFLGRPSGATNWGIDSKGTPAGSVTGAVSAASAAQLVYRIDFGASVTTSGNEVVRQYVNPSTVAEPGTADVTIADKGNFAWDNLRIQSGNGGTASFDEIRIGTTYADVVVPEPTSMALLGVGVAGLLVRRRRAGSVG